MALYCIALSGWNLLNTFGSDSQKECGAWKCNTVSAVCNLYTTWSHLTLNETLHSSQIPVAFPPHTGHFLHITERRQMRHENLATKSSDIFQFTIYRYYHLKPHSMPHKLLQHDTMSFFSYSYRAFWYNQSYLFTNECTSDCLKSNITIYIKVTHLLVLWRFAVDFDIDLVWFPMFNFTHFNKLHCGVCF